MSVRMVLLAGQARHEHIRDMADFWTEAVEVANVIPQERASEREQQHAAEKGAPRFLEETVVEVRSIPCERVQQQAVERMVGVQGGVIAVTETASQDRRLQRAAERALVDSVEAAQISIQEQISERMYEQFGVIEVSKNSSQENVEIVISLRSKCLSRRVNRSGLSKCPRSLPRKVSWSQVSLMSSLLTGRIDGSGLSNYPRSHTKKVLL